MRVLLTGDTEESDNTVLLKPNEVVCLSTTVFLFFWYKNTKLPLCSLYSEPSWDVYLAYPGKNGGELASLIKMQLEMRGLAVSVDPHDSPCLR